MSTPSPYTDQQVQFVIAARNERAWEFSRIAAAFQQRFGGTRTKSQMRHLYERHMQPEALVEVAGPPKPHPLGDFTHENFAAVRRATGKKSGRAFVTAASPVSTMSEKFTLGSREVASNLFVPGFKSVQTWVKETGGELVILPMRAHMPALNSQPDHYDPRLRGFRSNFAAEFQFSEHLRAMDVHLNPQQVRPLTGLHRVRGRQAVKIGETTVPLRANQSVIFAHAQQDLETLATGNNTPPRWICTTGAITKPEYLRNRVGVLAAEAHILGGLIVEWEEDVFWVRQVQFNLDDGSFVDMGVRYRPDGKVEKGVRAEALRLGDLHAGHGTMLDDAARLAKLVQPKRVFVEDVFDGGSINHHDSKKPLTRALKPKQFKSLEAELAECARVLKQVRGLADDAVFVIVDSNHHDFVTKWIESGEYVRDTVNYRLGHEMVLDLLDGRLPLQTRLDPEARFTWLTAEDDYFVAGVQMASHGHLGANGMRGSKAQLEVIHGDAMVGHMHTPSIRGRLYVVGHSSDGRHGYNAGPSSWLICRGVVWSGGAKQLIVSIDGRFGLDDTGNKVLS